MDECKPLLHGIELSLEEDGGKDSFEVTPALRTAAAKAIGLPQNKTRQAGGVIVKNTLYPYTHAASSSFAWPLDP